MTQTGITPPFNGRYYTGNDIRARILVWMRDEILARGEIYHGHYFEKALVSLRAESAAHEKAKAGMSDLEWVDHFMDNFGPTEAQKDAAQAALGRSVQTGRSWIRCPGDARRHYLLEAGEAIEARSEKCFDEAYQRFLYADAGAY